MEIGVYDRKDGFDARPARDYSLPAVQDVGQDFSRVGRSLLNAVEPQMRARAKNAAIEAVGEADIVKDEAGNWVRPEQTGGGLIYAEQFNQAMDQRYLGIVSKDFENDADRLFAEHRDDPEAFFTASTARAKTMLEGMNARVRADFDVNASREISERFRGLSNAKVVRDQQLAVGGLQSQIEEHQLAAARILTLGGPDAARLADVELAKTDSLFQSLVNIHGISPEGAKAERLSLAHRLGDKFDEADSQTGARGILLSIKNSDPDRLRWLADMGATDVDLPGEAYGLGKTAAQDYRANVPSEQTRRIIGAMARKELDDRAAQEEKDYQRAHDAAVLAAQQQQVATASQTLQAIRDGQYAPGPGLTKSQVAALNVSYNQNGTVFEQMDRPEGRRATLGFIAQSGIAPEGLKEYISAAVQSGKLYDVAEFVHAMRTTTSGASKLAVGQMIFNDLPKQVQVALQLEATGRRHGWPRPLVEDNVRRLFAGEIRPLGEVVGLVKNYGPSRNADIAEAMKVPIEIANANPRLQQEYDELFPYMVQVHQGDINAARSATAREVAVGWVPHKNFVGGIAPSAFAQSGITEYQLNQLPVIKDRATNPLQIRFGLTTQDGVQRAQLMPMSDSPTKGYGKYRIQFFTREGKPFSAVRVDLDQEWKNGIPQPPAPKVTASGAKWIPNNYDATGKFVGYRLRTDILAHPEKYWQGPRDKAGKPIIRKK